MQSLLHVLTSCLVFGSVDTELHATDMFNILLVGLAQYRLVLKLVLSQCMQTIDSISR